MRLKNCLLCLLVCSAFLSAEAEKNSIPWRENGFDPTKLLKKESYLPENFSINHLFSMGIVGFSTVLYSDFFQYRLQLVEP